MKVFVLTDCPSPYQVELFNEIEAKGECALEQGDGPVSLPTLEVEFSDSPEGP